MSTTPAKTASFENVEITQTVVLRTVVRMAVVKGRALQPTAQQYASAALPGSWDVLNQEVSARIVE